MMAVLTPALRKAAGECYIDVQETIASTVWAFVMKHGGDYYELLADANTAYMQGFIATIEGRHNSADFEVEIRRWVWFELFDRFRVVSQHRRTNKVVIKNAEFIEETAYAREQFNLTDFIDELSEDGRAVVKLVLDTPEDIAAMARAKGGGDRNLRSTMRQYLRGLGWTAERISESFEEVRKALEL